MPVYEFHCKPCDKKIEVLVMTGDTPSCPHCGGRDLERLFSVFASPGSGGPSSQSSCSNCGPTHNCSSCSCH